MRIEQFVKNGLGGGHRLRVVLQEKDEVVVQAGVDDSGEDLYTAGWSFLNG